MTNKIEIGKDKNISRFCEFSVVKDPYSICHSSSIPLSGLCTNQIIASGKLEGFMCLKTKSPDVLGALFILIRRRPTLPHRCQCSTIGAGGLNFRVRDGNGCDPSARVTGNSYKSIYNQITTGFQAGQILWSSRTTD